MRIFALSLYLLFSLQVQASFLWKWSEAISSTLFGQQAKVSSPVDGDDATGPNRSSSEGGAYSRSQGAVRRSVPEEGVITEKDSADEAYEEMMRGATSTAQSVISPSGAHVQPVVNELVRQPDAERSIPNHRSESGQESPDTSGFKSAIEKGDVEAAKVIFDKGNEEEKKYYGEYLISLGRERLVGLIKRSSGNDKYWLLSIIMLYAEEGLINEVFKEVEPSDVAWIVIACNADLACAPAKFINILKRITGRRWQKEAVKGGVEKLFDSNKTECINPLLSALESNTSLDQEVKDSAVKYAFLKASLHATDNRAASLAKAYYNHSAILAGNYSDALYLFYEKEDSKHELFYWLLKEADIGDLEAVKNNEEWKYMFNEFKEAINEALKTAKPAGTRTMLHHDIQVTEKAEELFENEIADLGMIEDLADVISKYVTPVAPTPRRRKQLAQRATEKALKQTTTSDVTSTPTGVKGSMGTGSEKGGAGGEVLRN